MTRFHPVMPHGAIQEVLPDVFHVMGTMRAPFFGSDWQFGRNMTVVRENGELTLINAVRLDEAGLAELEKLGTVKHVARIGSLHGHDDAFYVDRYGATFWAAPGMPIQPGLTVDKQLVPGGETPFSGCSVFGFEQTKLPEVILRLDRDGGVLIACDALQNWCEPDPFTSAESVTKMRGLGFFTPANLGVAWAHVNEPKGGDFARLKELSYEHVLCGHGTPRVGGAQAAYHATFKRMFDV